MNITKREDGDKLTIFVDGYVDTVTTPELESALKVTGKETLVLDLTDVPYMSSAGLRCLLAVQKKMMSNGGTLTITGVQSEVMEVFELTGFSDILTIT